MEQRCFILANFRNVKGDFEGEPKGDESDQNGD